MRDLLSHTFASVLVKHLTKNPINLKLTGNQHHDIVRLTSAMINQQRYGANSRQNQPKPERRMAVEEIGMHHKL